MLILTTPTPSLFSSHPAPCDTAFDTPSLFSRLFESIREHEMSMSELREGFAAKGLTMQAHARASKETAGKTIARNVVSIVTLALA
jgi:hypothetical protein